MDIEKHPNNEKSLKISAFKVKKYIVFVMIII
jgi:hypothetical protein